MNPDSPVPPINPLENQPPPAVEQPRSSPLALLGFLLSIFTPPIGLIISIIALRAIRKQRAQGQKLAIAGIVIGSVLTLLSLLAGAIILNFLNGIGGGGHSNQAQVNLQPILAQVQKLGGKAICNDGDNGYSLDNSEPWYEIYYTIPSTSNLTTNVENIASSQGYMLAADNSTINQLKGGGGYGGEQYNPASDYLVGKHDNASLSITINRDTSVALNCDTGTYGRLQKTGDGAIIDFSMTLPSTN